MRFAVFNFADICVCVGVGLLVLSILLDGIQQKEKAGLPSNQSVKECGSPEDGIEKKKDENI